MAGIYQGNTACEGQTTPTSDCAEVKITKVENGFVVGIGCKVFVGTDWVVLAGQIGEYFADPVAAQKKYCK